MDRSLQNQQTSQVFLNPQENKEKQIEQASYMDLFRFATKFDVMLMVVGSICACAMGTALPSFALLWGNMTDSFGDNNKMVETSKGVMFNFIQIGVGTVFAGWGMFGCWMITGQRQGIECRKQYLKSLLKQQIGWFDTINQSQLSTKFATDSFAFQEAIGEKVSTLIMTIAMFIAGFIIAFIKGWLMTLVTLATLPAIGLGGYLYSTAIAKKDSQLQKQYSAAGGKAEQAIAAIKTVKQLNGEQHEADQYSATLVNVTKNSTKYGVFIGIGLGSLFGFMLMSYSLGFWFGSNCVEDTQSCPSRYNNGRAYSAGDVLVIFFSILMAGFNFTQLTPAIKKMSQGRSAAARIFKIIDRKPLILSAPNAIKPTSFKGVFRFEGVTFAYPKDRSKNILENLTLQISCKSTAFVGESGCGKSTIFQLMMRFYDPDNGRITLDGIDIRDLDIYWLRQQIGYVGQQPVLFATTLKENLLFGKEDATQEEIDHALRMAEAYDFVYNLKDKLETFAGTAGGQISGGQKQRLAIARALLKNPKILLLDEATSALDRRNQKNIQETLNKIAEEKTTITIAHRVKTIMKCDMIYVLQKGRIAEKGRFNQLQRYKDINIEQQIDVVSPQKQGNSPTKQPAKEQIDQCMVKFEVGAAVKQIKDQPNKQQQQSLNEEERQKKRKEQLLQKYDKSIFGRLFSYTSHRRGLFALGIIICICNGLLFPIFSIFLAKMLAILIKFDNNKAQARTEANLYALLYLILGIIAFILNVIQQSIFTTIGEEMTQKIRNETYLKILKMPIVWLDLPRNNSGALSARLASDCQTVNGLTTTYVSILIQNIANLVSGMIIALIYEWRTSLVAIGLIPLMIISGAIQMAFTTGFSAKTDVAYKDSSSLITESMINIRTVTSFGYENMILDKYSSKLKEPFEIGVKKGNISGILFGFSQLIMYVVFALIFYLGAVFIRDNNLSIADVFTAIYSIMFAGMTAGNNSHFMPDVASAKNSAANIFEILDGEDEDELQIKEGSKLLKTPIKGDIELRNVSFKYESRDEYVFKNMNLHIKSGWKVGFVGPSGCGKSTIHQLLQRFYDVNGGEILIDGVDIKDYDVHHLRGSFGVVSQEPVLFNDTIGNNIKYNRYDATMEDIRSAANQSNFNPEVEKLGDVKKETQTNGHTDGQGFDKNVGVKGTHISGGQKQRVAIARVVIRKPQLLLLDEATSALDSANEKKVQDSLDRIMQNRTCINIAHRIQTIRNSNVIMVFEKGVIVEKGTYDELLGLKGHFYKLQKGLQFV